MSWSPMNGKMRRVARMGVFLALVALAGSYSSNASAESLTEALLAYKKQVEPHLPVKVDDETRLDAVDVKGDTLSFRYTLLTVTKDEFSKEELLELLRSVAAKDSCGNPNLRGYLDKGAKFSFTYRTKKNEQLASFTIDKSACKTR